MNLNIAKIPNDIEIELGKIKNLKERILYMRSKGYSYKRIEERLSCAKSTIAYHCGEGRKERQANYQKEYRRTKVDRENPFMVE